MSMSTHVIGFKPPDEKWRAMKAIWDACAAAKVKPPEEVHRFFDFEAPDEAGVEVDIERQGSCTPFNDADKAASGFEVDVRKLPPDVVIIRFYNSY